MLQTLFNNYESGFSRRKDKKFRKVVQLQILEQMLDKLPADDASQFDPISFITRFMDTNGVLSSIFSFKLHIALDCRNCPCKQGIFEEEERNVLFLSPPFSSAAINTVEEALENCMNIGNDEGLRCVKCDSQGHRTVAIRYTTLPKALIIHLQRFSGLVKDGKFIKFGEILDLTPLLHEEAEGVLLQYRLNSVMVHYGGTSARTGHYISFVRGKEPGTWARKDSTSIEVCSLEQVLQLSASVLVYEQMDYSEIISLPI